MRTASIVVGNYPHCQPLRSGTVTPRSLKLDFLDYDPVHDAFDEMVQRQAFDVCEIAVGAFFQAVAAGKPLRLLPVSTLGRFHHGAVYANPEHDLGGPRGLEGARVAVRSYSQTTGLWARGVLADQYGVDLSAITWVVTESSHLESFQDPSNVEHAPDGMSVNDLLETGAVSAAVMAPGAKPVPWRKPLIDDYLVNEQIWFEQHGFPQINHLVCVGPSLAERPDLASEVYDAFCRSYRRSGVLDVPGPNPISIDRSTIADVLSYALGSAEDQGLVPAGLDVADMFAEFQEVSADA